MNVGAHRLAGVGVRGVGAGHLIFARVKPIPVLAGYGLSHGSRAITNHTQQTFNTHLHSQLGMSTVFSRRATTANVLVLELQVSAVSIVVLLSFNNSFF
jgi:hypothetical protein